MQLEVDHQYNCGSSSVTIKAMHQVIMVMVACCRSGGRILTLLDINRNKVLVITTSIITMIILMMMKASGKWIWLKMMTMTEVVAMMVTTVLVVQDLVVEVLVVVVVHEVGDVDAAVVVHREVVELEEQHPGKTKQIHCCTCRSSG